MGSTVNSIYIKRSAGDLSANVVSNDVFPARRKFLFPGLLSLLLVLAAVPYPTFGYVPKNTTYSALESESTDSTQSDIYDQLFKKPTLGVEKPISRVQSLDFLGEVEVLHERANEGDVDAQLLLYHSYLDGDKVGRDTFRAIYWLRQAAKQNQPDAVHELAALLLEGKLIDQNFVRARELFEQAAAAGILEAKTNLGIIYAGGLGVEADAKRAESYFRAAAEEGEPFAANEFGIILLSAGKYDQARQWFKQAAAQNNSRAIYNLGLMQERGLGQPKNLKAALEQYEEAARADVPEALTKTGRAYLNGLGVEVDLNRARQLLIRAYMSGEPYSAIFLSVFPPTNVDVWVDKDDVGQVLIGGIAQNEPVAILAMGARKMSFSRSDADVRVGLQLIESVAKSGNSFAQTVLGRTYEDGFKVAKDPSVAAGWYRLAAENGNLTAMRRLAFLYYYGHGVDKNLKEFFRLLSKAAETGQQLARYDLAVAHRNGDGVKKDQPLALRKFTELAMEGMPLAQYELARIYALDDSGATDKNKARYWLERLVQVGSIDFQVKAADIYSEVLEDYSAALRLYQAAVDQDHPSATNSLGVMYKLGKGVAKSWPRAIELYKKAAELGDPFGSLNYGYAFSVGEGVEQNYSEAFKWTELAAAKGNEVAENNMGNFYYHGTGVEIDYRKAREWYEKSAAKNYSGAFNNLGGIYLNGFGVDADRGKAESLFQQAADMGDVNAKKTLSLFKEENRVRALLEKDELTPYEMYDYANAFLLGINGIPQNKQLGFELARRSMESGYSHSYLLIATLYERGEGIEKDIEKGIGHLREAAEDLELYDAMKRLADIYLRGAGVEKNECTALDWYRRMSLVGGDKGPGVINFLLGSAFCQGKAGSETMQWLQQRVERQEPNAICLRALLHSIGVGVEKAVELSWQLQKRAASLGSPTCQMRVAVAYATGNGVKKDRPQAFDWLQKAARSGSADACQNMAYFLLTGPRKERDTIEIYKWYWLSVETGNYENMEMINKLEQNMSETQIAEAKMRGKRFVQQLTLR